MEKIGIIDYGMSNLSSVLNAFHYLNQEATVLTKPEQVKDFTKLVLPGVGAFGEAIGTLNSTGFTQSLDAARRNGIPILGICLGMQLMCNSSTEGGFFQGLGWIDATVERLPENSGIKIPHIGWNNLKLERPHLLTAGIPDQADVYFVHSYEVKCRNPQDVIATCAYGDEFTAMFAHENTMGIQFHPEKSQMVGLRILQNYARFISC